MTVQVHIPVGGLEAHIVHGMATEDPAVDTERIDICNNFVHCCWQHVPVSLCRRRPHYER